MCFSWLEIWGWSRLPSLQIHILYPLQKQGECEHQPNLKNPENNATFKNNTNCFARNDVQLFCYNCYQFQVLSEYHNLYSSPVLYDVSLPGITQQSVASKIVANSFSSNFWETAIESSAIMQCSPQSLLPC